MPPAFTYNALHLALVSLMRGNLYACENYLRQAKGHHDKA